jgi:hypothetical protein
LVSEAINVGRFDYASGVLQGLLLEVASTNLLTRSEAFDNAAWGKTASTVAVDSLAAPDTNVVADKLVDTSAMSGHAVTQNLTFPSTANVTKYALSCVAKAGERRYVELMVFGASAGWNAYCAFDLLTGTMGTIGVNSGTSVSASIVVINGFYRCSLMATPTASSTGLGSSILINNSLLPNDSSYLGDGTSGLYLWGAMLEQAATPSTYFPTAGTAATRGGETLSLNWGLQGIPEGACFHRVTFDDLSTQLLAGTVASGIATIAAASLNRSRVRKVDYILASTPPVNRRLTLSDNFA